MGKLAKEMGVSVSDLAGFIECLKVWMNKGYTMDQAIEQHMKQMNKIVNNTLALSKVKSIAISTFYE